MDKIATDAVSLPATAPEIPIPQVGGSYRYDPDTNTLTPNAPSPSAEASNNTTDKD